MKLKEAELALQRGEEGIDELDMAAQTLAQHDGQDNDEYRLLNYSLLFKTNQAGEACAQALNWVRSAPPGSLCFEGAMDAISLMLERSEGAAALQLCHTVIERLRGAIALLGGSPTPELRAAYSDTVVRSHAARISLWIRCHCVYSRPTSLSCRHLHTTCTDALRLSPSSPPRLCGVQCDTHSRGRETMMP